ncbi:MAG: ABC transporter substrate-binding protein [Solobacterium sp.]|jgi:peptide/nickel transport system substrate-binding protein|nr:ABC transporter substrate-binding protein [Solobacterium sp.]
MKKLGLALLSVLLLSACGNASASASSDSASATAAVQTVSAAAEVPDTVRTVMGSEPDSLDPFQSAASDTEAVMLNVFDGLVRFDSEGKIIPGIAESWDISEDGLTYTFHLRNDVKFHNGNACTSKDVLYTYQKLSGMNSGGEAISSKFSTITDLEAPDDKTVVMTISQRNASFLELCKIAVVPADYTDQASAPIGAGPYKFVEYIPGQKIVLERFDDYYDKDRMPRIRNVEVYIMTDSSSIVQALQSGQIDYASVGGKNADVLKDQFDIYSNPQNMVCLLALNNSVAPLDSKLVRQAITCAINKQDIINGAFDGYGTELYTNFSPVMAFYYNDQLSGIYSYDVDHAKELLKEAGYENGFDLTITVPGNYQNHVDTAAIIKEELKEIGINVEINQVEWGTWLEDVYKGADYEATVIGLTGKLDPNDVLGRYASDYSRNFFRYSNPDYDAIIKEALEETDEDKRAELYKEAQKILTEDAAAVWTTDPNNVVACRKDLKGYTAYPISFMDFSSLYYEE